MSESQGLALRCNVRRGSLNVSANVELRRAWTVVFGPSGSGKSTLLRVIAGLLRPGEAHVSIGGESVGHLPPHRRRIGFVAQQAGLFPHMTARENVSFAIAASARLHNSANTLGEADELLRRFHATSVADRKPREMSGGEAQRVAIARAVAAAPRVLLLDEVFTGMQTSLRLGTIALLREEQIRRGGAMQIISVTHNVAEALSCADEAVKIDGGRVVAQGDPRDVLAAERGALLEELS